MRTQNYKARISWKAIGSWKLQGIAAGLLLMVASMVAGCSDRSAAKSVATAPQVTFAAPAEAAQALKAAAQAGDESALQQILGPSSKSFANKDDRDLFVAKFDQMNRWVLMTDGSEVLHIGADNFPFPVPIQRGTDAKWRFNSEAGEQEVLARRIGANELLAIDACAAIDKAEELYAKKSREDGTTPAYTERIISSPRKRDGLYWEVPEGHKASPLGRVETFAPSAIASAASGGPIVIDGYSYRILTAQGPDAEGGARDYLVNGKLTGGYAVLATPVKYGETGIMTFLLGPEGFFERDLGNATSEYASTTKEFNPTDEWSVVE